MELKGGAIPEVARWFAVIDTFDALTSLRPYRSEIGADVAKRAIAELELGVGARYAAEPVAAFADLYHTGRLKWILNSFNDTCPVPEYTMLADAGVVAASERRRS